MPAWLKYTLLRIGVFALALAVLLLTPIGWPLATAFAAAIALLVSLTLFGRLRAEVAKEMAARRPRVDTVDDLVEDAQIAEAQKTGSTIGRRGAPVVPDAAVPPDAAPPSEGERDGEEHGVAEHGDRGELERGHQLSSGASGQHDDDRWQA